MADGQCQTDTNQQKRYPGVPGDPTARHQIDQRRNHQHITAHQQLHGRGCWTPAKVNDSCTVNSNNEVPIPDKTVHRVGQGRETPNILRRWASFDQPLKPTNAHVSAPLKIMVAGRISRPLNALPSGG